MTMWRHMWNDTDDDFPSRESDGKMILLKQSSGKIVTCKFSYDDYYLDENPKVDCVDANGVSHDVLDFDAWCYAEEDPIMPKIYVPSPGRPPEWVVDLMVEGRIVVKIIEGERFYTCKIAGRHFHQIANEGQAIRLNEDGSLEIIEAPADDEHASSMREIAELRDTIDGLQADLDSAVEVAWKHGAHEWVKANYPDFAEPIFTQNQVLEALSEGIAYARLRKSECAFVALRKVRDSFGLSPKQVAEASRK